MSGFADTTTATVDDAQARLAVQAAIIRAQAALLDRQSGLLNQIDLPGGVGFWSCRLRDETLDWSGNAFDIFGIRRGRPLRRAQILDLYEPASRRLLDLVRSRAIARGAGFAFDTEIITPAGERRWVRTQGRVETRDGAPIRIYGTHQDVSADIARIADLSRKAELDPLTGLPNRRAFERCCYEPEVAGRSVPAALILVDLDGFKAVNDDHGHEAGDACLRISAARLARICTGAELVARIGGDEFAVLVSGPTDPAILSALGGAIVAGLGRPFGYGEVTLRIGASVGIALADTFAARDLFARADAALYAAKESGRNAAVIDGNGGEVIAGARPGRAGR